MNHKERSFNDDEMSLIYTDLSFNRKDTSFDYKDSSFNWRLPLAGAAPRPAPSRPALPCQRHSKDGPRLVPRIRGHEINHFCIPLPAPMPVYLSPPSPCLSLSLTLSDSLRQLSLPLAPCPFFLGEGQRRLYDARGCVAERDTLLDNMRACASEVHK